MMKKTRLVFSIACLMAVAATFPPKTQAAVAESAVEQTKTPNKEASVSSPPKLVVQIVVSQLRYDYLNKYAKNFAKGGFARLLHEGVTCENARYGYMFTQTSPGMTTLVTGTQPAQHGIIGDSWINYTTNENVSSVGDSRMSGVGCIEDEGKFSPAKLLVSTVGDEIKNHDDKSKVISIALDPASAVLAGGCSADAVYWFDTHYGNWATSNYYTSYLPSWVETFNKSNYKETYIDRIWSVSKKMGAYLSQERTDIQLDSVIKLSFDLLLKPRNRDLGKLVATPFGNSMLKDFAMQTINNENLGKDDHPDLLVLTFSATQGISQKYGTLSVEMEDAIYRMDKDLEQLMGFLDEKIGQDNYVVVLTSDHGSSDTQRMTSRMPSGKFNAMQFKVLMGGFLNAQLGDGVWVADYKNRQLYLNRRQIYEKGLSLEEVQNKVAVFALQFTGVANAVTASALQMNYYGEGIMQQIQNSFFPKHSGDIIINLLPGWIEVEGEGVEYSKMSDSGSPYEYDRHVPLMWYGAGITPAVILDKVDMADVAPTICDLLKVNHPNAVTGKAIKQVVNRK